MKRRRFKFLLLLCAMVLAASCQRASAQEPQQSGMTNKDVIDLAALGLGDDVVIEKIRTAPQTAFVTDLESLKALKAAHVSDAVIRVMINPKAAAASPAPTPAVAPAPPGNPDVPDEVVAYLKRPGKLTQDAPEVV